MDLEPIQFVLQGKLNSLKRMNHEKRRAIMKQTERQNLNKPQFVFGLIEVVVFIVCLYLLFLSTVTCPMNEVLTASTGVIMSQSPGSGFPHFESCSWVVKVEPGYNITFTIEHFQTSRQFDELEIFDGESAYIVHTEHMYTNGYLQYRVIIFYFFTFIFYQEELIKHLVVILVWVMPTTCSIQQYIDPMPLRPLPPHFFDQRLSQISTITA